MTTVTRRMLDLLELQRETFGQAGAPTVEARWRYWIAARALWRTAAYSTTSVDEARDAVDAFGEADRQLLTLASETDRWLPHEADVMAELGWPPPD